MTRWALLALALATSVPGTTRAQDAESDALCSIDLWEVDATILAGQQYLHQSTSDGGLSGTFSLSESLRLSRRFSVGEPRLALDVGVDIRFPILDQSTDLGLALIHLGIMRSSEDQAWDLSVVLDFGGGLEFFSSPLFAGTGSRASLDAGGRIDVRYYPSDANADPRLFIGVAATGGAALLGSELVYWSLGVSLGFTTGKRSEHSL